MKRIVIFTLGGVLSFVALFSSAAQEYRRFRLMEWNVENMFDTLHDYGKDDAGFLPDGEYRWTSRRYWAKQGALARTILEAGAMQPVDVVMMCEVENDSVLRDLTCHTRMASLDYEYVVTSCDDQRGVDVALLYQPTTFRLVGTETRKVGYNAEKERPTRDVLLCTGVIPTGDTIDVVAVHFPSRRGGVSITAEYRKRAAAVVRSLTDSLKMCRKHPAIVVLGDCNDEPGDASVRMISEGGLRNVSERAVVANDQGDSPRKRREKRYIRGTYFLQHEWSRIDNVLVSEDAVRRFKVGECMIYAPDHLLEYDKDGFLMPWRTYRGTGYHGGVSDHLPLLLDLWY